ncbi:MAG TPA: hypothetical protein VGB10_07410 [Bacteroidota bacterium]
MKPEFRIIAEGVVTLDRGTTNTLKVEYKDSTGSIVTLPPETYQWKSTVPGVVTVSPSGVLTAGPGLGQTYIIVREPGGAQDSALIWVQVPQSSPSEFNITLVYQEDVPEGWRSVLEYAAERWERVIRSTLQEVALNMPEGAIPTLPGEPLSPPFPGTERGVRVYVSQSSSFPPGTYVEAVGGPHLQRKLPHPTTILGVIYINRDKSLNNIRGDRLRYAAVHEMGHVLGLSAVIQGFQPEWFDARRGITKGKLTLDGYRRQFHAVVDSIDVSNGFHWPFSGDVMSAFYPVEEITTVSIGALMDLGYPAAWYGAGRY